MDIKKNPKKILTKPCPAIIGTPSSCSMLYLDTKASIYSEECVVEVNVWFYVYSLG